MKDLEGTKTEKNLWEAFAGESKARVKYEFYAKQARKDGYEQVGDFFEETSRNEKEHAKIWFKHLNGGKIPDTVTNLLDCIAGENYEWTSMYENFAKDAKEEGFESIAVQMANIGDIERHHEDRYQKLHDNITSGTEFKKAEAKVWVCAKCGHRHSANEAPGVCPVCAHPQGYFAIENDDY